MLNFAVRYQKQPWYYTDPLIPSVAPSLMGSCERTDNDHVKLHIFIHLDLNQEGPDEYGAEQTGQDCKECE